MRTFGFFPQDADIKVVYLVCWEDNDDNRAHLKIFNDEDHYRLDTRGQATTVIEIDQIRDVTNFNKNKQFGFEILDYHGNRTKFLCKKVIYAKRWLSALQTLMSHYRKTSNAIITEGGKLTHYCC